MIPNEEIDTLIGKISKHVKCSPDRINLTQYKEGWNSSFEDIETDYFDCPIKSLNSLFEKCLKIF